MTCSLLPLNASVSSRTLKYVCVHSCQGVYICVLVCQLFPLRLVTLYLVIQQPHMRDCTPSMSMTQPPLTEI